MYTYIIHIKYMLSHSLCCFIYSFLLFIFFYFFSRVTELSQAQRSFAKCLEGFKFECIGSTQTDDERVICKSLEEFSRLINAIEDERGRMVRVQYNYNNLMPYNVPYLRFILYTVSGKPRQTPTIYRDIVCM